MCGIYCCISRLAHQQISKQTRSLLSRRGPDSLQEHQVVIDNVHLTFVSSVLSMRGGAIVSQPLLNNASGSVFCWNGEAWKVDGAPVTGNDSQRVFEMLLTASSSPASSTKNVLRTFSRIQGPYACVFYDACNKKLYFGRDCLGRRSLVQTICSNGDVVVASVSDSILNEHWTEVEGDGIYILSISDFGNRSPGISSIEHYPLYHLNESEPDQGGIAVPFTTFNVSVPDIVPDRVNLSSAPVNQLEILIKQALELRVQNRPETITCPIGVLFSGGLDCTLLTYYCHLTLPLTVPIDLLNVAFQNPRIHDDKLDDPYTLCPDRITGLAAFEALKRQCPGRHFRLVAINVPYLETMAHRETVISLMHPHNTEMDLSIASALFFASRGQGLVSTDSGIASYTSPSRILLSGLGADELFGGYSRHAVAFARRSFAGLLAELDLDFNRLGKRNLGRDDRVTSHWGREVRYPFLDENLVKWAVDAPVWHKCGFGTQVLNHEEPLIEDGKLVLRLLAWKAGLTETAIEKKRAIQFGSRTAKMYAKKTKGTDTLSALPEPL